MAHGKSARKRPAKESRLPLIGLAFMAVVAIAVSAFAFTHTPKAPAPTIDMAKAEAAQKSFEKEQADTAARVLAENEPLKLRRPADRPLSVLFAGDLITVGKDASTQETSFRVLTATELGKGGPVDTVRIGGISKTTADVYPEAVAVSRPSDLVIVELGTNDVYKNTPEVFAKDYSMFLTAIRKASPKAPLICVGVWQSSPVGATLDLTIEAECKARGGRFVSLRAVHANPANKSIPGTPQFAGGMTDGAHPNDDGHALIFAGIMDKLNLTG